MIINSTFGTAEFDPDKPFGIPYHGRIEIGSPQGHATFKLPNGKSHTYPLDNYSGFISFMKHRYLRGAQVFKIRDGAPPQTAEQRAAGQRFTDYAVIHSVATDPPKALIGGAVVENGSYIYHSPISGNWLVGVSGEVGNNVAYVRVTLTPFGVIGEDDRKPVTRLLQLQDAGQNDADSKPIINWRKGELTNKYEEYPETRFLVTFHTASHDGRHASLAVVITRRSLEVWSEYKYVTAEYEPQFFAVGWLALRLSDPQDAVHTTPPDVNLEVQYDRVQTLGLRFKDDYTGITSNDFEYQIDELYTKVYDVKFTQTALDRLQDTKTVRSTYMPT
ncbi:MAG: hypothetical protein ACP5GC_07130 [Thiomonas sp.]